MSYVKKAQVLRFAESLFQNTREDVTAEEIRLNTPTEGVPECNTVLAVARLADKEAMMSTLRHRRHLRKHSRGKRVAGCLDAVNYKSGSINFQTLVEQSVDVICQVEQLADGSMRYNYVSPSADEVLGWTAEEMKSLTHRTLYPPASLAIIKEAGKQLVAGAPSTMVVVEAIRKDGRRIWLENHVRTLTEDGCGNRNVVVCMRDITTRKLLQDQLASLVLVDALTGVGNRRAFDAALNREWQHAVERHSPLSLMLIDVDFFKKINDTYGHQAGDECIRLVAQKLTELLNRPEAFVARYGGDELAVLLPGIDKLKAHDLGNELCHGIAATALLPTGDTSNAQRLTISCGVSTVLIDRRSDAPKYKMTQVPAKLIAAADRALYSAKCLGRNQAAVADLA